MSPVGLWMVWYLVAFVSPARRALHLGGMSLSVGTQGRYECPQGRSRREGELCIESAWYSLGKPGRYRLYWGLICLHSMWWSSMSSCPQEPKNLGAVCSRGSFSRPILTLSSILWVRVALCLLDTWWPSMCEHSFKHWLSPTPCCRPYSLGPQDASPRPVTARLTSYSPGRRTPSLFLMASGPQSRLISGTVEVGLQPSLAFASDAPQRLGHFIKACFTRGRPCAHNSRREAAALPIFASADRDSASDPGPAGWPWDLPDPVLPSKGSLQRSHGKGGYLNAFLEGPQIFTGELRFDKIGSWLEMHIGNHMGSEGLGSGTEPLCLVPLLCRLLWKPQLFRSQRYGT